MNELNMILGANEDPIEGFNRDWLRGLFAEYILDHDHNQDAFNVHPAFGVACDYRDNGTDNVSILQRLAQAINHAYTAEELAVCNEGWGGVDGVSKAEHLVNQVFLWEADAETAEGLALYRLMVACGFETQAYLDEVLADIATPSLN